MMQRNNGASDGQNAAVMKRVAVIGCPSGGKSTFARRLQQITGLPLVHLDNVWWKPDRTHIPREAFDAALEQILAEDEWIVDGNYSRTLEPRIRACDTVVFLDYDEQTCIDGLNERLGRARPDMPWTEDTLDPELVALVKRFRTEERPTTCAILERYADRRILIFHTRAEADRWLDRI